MNRYNIISICLICLLLFSAVDALGFHHLQDRKEDIEFEEGSLEQQSGKEDIEFSPVITDPNPSDGEEGLNSTPTLSVSVSHPEEKEMNVSFYNNDTEVLIGDVEGVLSGERAEVVWENRAPDSVYSWHVVADDGENDTQEGPWNFITPVIDYVNITDEVNGTALEDKRVPPNYEEWGNLSTYNETYGFFDNPLGEWDASGDAELLEAFENEFNGVNVGGLEDDVWFNVTTLDGEHSDSVKYSVLTDQVGHIEITDSPNGEPIQNDTVGVGRCLRGYCSVYNESGEYLYTVEGNWSAEGADSSLLEDSVNESNVIDVGHEGGPVWFNLSYEGFNDSIRLDVSDPEPDEIDITYEPDGESIVGGVVPVGYKTWGNASAYNDTAGYIGTVEVNWSVGYGEGMDPTTGPSPAESSWIDVGTSPGEVVWNASYERDNFWVNDTVEFTVEPGEAVEFRFDTIENQVAGEAFEITITAYDSEGNVDTNYVGTANLTDTTGTIESVETGAFTDGNWTGEANITEAQDEVVISAEDDDMTGDSNSFNVDPSEADHIEITPKGSTIIAGQAETYTAVSYDGFGNEIGDVTGETNWSDNVDPVEDSYWVDNEITVNKTGTWTITGEYDGIGNTTTLDVDPAAALYFEFDTIENQEAGVPFEITITAYDGHDNLAEDYSGIADLTDDTGTIDPVETDVFTGGTWTGEVTIMEAQNVMEITAVDQDDPGITGTSNEFTVEPPEIDHIEITKDGGEFSGDSVPVNHTVEIELSAYNDTLGHIGFVEGEWEIDGGDAFLLNGTIGVENGINVGTVPGEVLLTVQYDDYIDEVIFTVESPEVDYIRIIEDSEDPASIISNLTIDVGEGLEGYSAGFNETIGYVGLVETNWLVNNYDGAEGSTSPSHGNSSVFDSGPFGGEAEWIAEYEGYLIDTVELQILPPDIDQILIRSEPDGGGDVLEDIDLEQDEEVSLFPAGYNDTFGYQEDLEVGWSLDDDQVGELTGTQGDMTTFVPSQPGTVNITALYESVETTIEVRVFDEHIPEIAGDIPDLKLERNFGIYEINLTEYAHDEYDDVSELEWYITGKRSSIISTYGENQTGNHILTFLSEENATGKMDVRYWLVNSIGNKVSQSAWINVTTEYESPSIRRCPDLYVQYDEPYEFDYSPYIIYDADRFDELELETDDPEHTTVDDLKVTYEYPEDMLGEEFLVTITVSDEQESVSTVISVTVTSNSPPVELEELPDITIDQGELKENVFDLDDYFSDPDGEPLYMSYGYTYLTITIHDDHSVDIKADSSWHGVERVTFRAKDPVGAIVEQTINVTVLPVNHPPKIKELPPLVVRYDEPYEFDLEFYINDPDNETHELTITTNSPDYVDVEGTKLRMIYPKREDDSKPNYTEPLEISVSDGIETASEVTTVTVGSYYPPELVIPLHDITFKENEQLLNAFNLDNHFIDRQDDTMYFTSGNENIEVVIHENNTVDFHAPENWHGQELITIRATNSAGALMEDSLTVTVIPVNNLPVISQIPKQEGVVGNSWILDMGDHISDVDNDTHELEVIVDDPYVDVYGHKLLFEYDQPGEYNVTVEVSDGLNSTTGYINVDVEGSEPSPWYSNSLVFLLGLVPIGLIGAVLYVKKGDYTIEDIFLIQDSGVLIKHMTRTLNSDRDEDILAGMFTAVQNFVDDAFAEEDDEVLKRMEYGDKKVLVHKGESVILAVFVSGDEPKWALEGMKNLVSDIEERYDESIKNWSGDLSDISGITEMLEALHKGKGKYRSGDWKKYSED
ncbi:MAG: hypothetical protein R6W73_01450 [Candidatus Saliniplasma sp.]